MLNLVVEIVVVKMKIYFITKYTIKNKMILKNFINLTTDSGVSDVTNKVPSLRKLKSEKILIFNLKTSNSFRKIRELCQKTTYFHLAFDSKPISLPRKSQVPLWSG